MTRGKQTCKILKEIRQEIADKNEIAYTTSECHFDGECQGTCPKCEAELKYLENELHRRKQLGKTAAIAGISLGIASTFSACNAPQQKNTSVSNSEPETVTEIANIEIIPAIQNKVIDCVTLGELTTLDGDVVDVNDFFIDTIVPIEDDYEIYKEDIPIVVGGIVDEIYPEFQGGEEARIKFLQENLVYPQEAKEKGIEGKVYIGFVVEKDSSLTNFTIVRSAHPLLDEEALRVVKLMPKWIPGKQKDKAIRFQFNIPIVFKLDDK